MHNTGNFFLGVCVSIWIAVGLYNFHEMELNPTERRLALLGRGWLGAGLELEDETHDSDAE